ncbi:MAG: MFS transporter, partial [Myxococcota bacterium]|nr:MFS transporter [Myxococcota bacterium]
MRQEREISLSYFFFLGIMASMGPYLTKELQEKGVEPLGLILSLPALVGLFCTPIWGALADWLRRGKILLLLAIGFIFLGVGGLALAPISGAIWFMFLYALGRGPVSPFLDSIAMSQAKENYGRLRLWGSIGFMVSIALCSLLERFFDFSSLYVAFVLCIPMLLVSYRLSDASNGTSLDIKRAFKQLIGNTELFLVLLAGAVHFAAHASNGAYLAIYIDFLHEDTLWTGISIATGIVVEIIVLAYAATIYRRFLVTHLFLIASVIAIVRWIAMFFAESGLFVLLCQASHGLTFGLFWLAIVSWIDQLSPPGLKKTGQSLMSASVGGIGVGGGVYFGTMVFDNFSVRHIYI